MHDKNDGLVSQTDGKLRIAEKISFLEINFYFHAHMVRMQFSYGKQQKRRTFHRVGGLWGLPALKIFALWRFSLLTPRLVNNRNNPAHDVR